MKCKQCDIEIESKGTKPKLFCSDACRKKWKRTQDKKRTEQADTSGQTPETGQTAQTTQQPDEQEAAQATKSDNHEHCPGLTIKDECPSAEDLHSRALEEIGGLPDKVEGKFIGLDEPIIITDDTPLAECCFEDHTEHLAYYHDCPDMYVQRQEPDKLNWGKWMNGKQLRQAGLKANRVPIPGDWDYEGCVAA